MLAVDILTESVHRNLSNLGSWLFLEMYDEAAAALFLDMYSICSVPESGREYLYDLFI